jgi:oligosaccharide repeat unit polymerase
LFFLLFGALRTSTDQDLQLVDYLKAFSDVPEDLDVNTIEVTYNLYTSMNLGTLNRIHESNDELFWGAYTFRPLAELLRLDTALGIVVPEELDTVRLLGTILADPYLDYGLAGICVFALIYGALGMLTYKLASRRANLAYTLLWATFSFAMVMAVFANFFNVLFTWLCFGYSALLLLRFSSATTRHG